jgi:hypothetical protein
VIKTQHCGSIDEVVALFDQELVGEELRDEFSLGATDYLWTSGGTLLPSMTASFASPYLYRGQVQRHSPCVASVFRGLTPSEDPNHLPPKDRARLLIDRVRADEFVLALDAHPAAAYAREIGLRLRPYAIAQHYEMPTDRLDLTQDHRVAAFFATHTFRDGRWLPVEEGVGIMYRLHATSFYRHFQEHLEAIGKQVWPRPTEQRAYALVLALGQDFEALPLEVYTFDQGKASEAIGASFDGGATLFPPDDLATVASVIRNAPTLSRAVLASVLGAPDTMPETLVSDAQAFLERHSDVRFCDRAPISLSSSQVEAADAKVQEMRESGFGLGFALAVRHV